MNCIVDYTLVFSEASDCTYDICTRCSDPVLAAGAEHNSNGTYTLFVTCPCLHTTHSLVTVGSKKFAEGLALQLTHDLEAVLIGRAVAAADRKADGV